MVLGIRGSPKLSPAIDAHGVDQGARRKDRGSSFNWTEKQEVAAAAGQVCVHYCIQHSEVL